MPTGIPTISQLTPALLSAIVAGIVSIVFRFVPSISDWFDEKTPAQKQQFMLVATLLIGLIIGAYNMARTGIDEQSVIVLLLTIYASVTSNQVTYQYIKAHPSDDPDMPF